MESIFSSGLFVIQIVLFVLFILAIIVVIFILKNRNSTKEKILNLEEKLEEMNNKIKNQSL